MARALIVASGIALLGVGVGAAWRLGARHPGAVSAIAPTAQASRLPAPLSDSDDERPTRGGALREAGAPPDDLVRTEILAAMDRVKPRVGNCFDLYNQPGLATVRMTVTSSGHVASARVIGALEGTPTAECVEGVARTASFRPFKRPSVTLTWPFVLKPEGDE